MRGGARRLAVLQCFIEREKPVYGGALNTSSVRSYKNSNMIKYLYDNTLHICIEYGEIHVKFDVIL